jgi:hypothetical protein
MSVLSNFGAFGYFPGGELNPLPAFSYTGDYTLIDDDSGNWRIKFLTTGVLTMSKTHAIDVFLVGGAGGASRYGAGGGGYTATHLNFSLLANTPYQIIIGSGGPGVAASVAGNGSQTSAFGFLILGGNGGAYTTGFGGAGGSGGGGGDIGGTGGNGGTDGADGAPASEGQLGGTGQGTTTKEFA